MTQNRILEQLRDLGVDISAGQISNILLNGHDVFHDEKDQLLPAAREVSNHLHCDDTSARHQGKAAVCTHIGNELFASFSTTDSKSRLNFLRLLCQGDEEQYRWCEESLESLRAFGVSKKLLAKMTRKSDGVWKDRAAWEQQLKKWRLGPKDATRISEAALCGKLLTETWYSQIGLVSDDAPQFKLFGLIHGLCWVHGERKIDRLIPFDAVPPPCQRAIATAVLGSVRELEGLSRVADGDATCRDLIVFRCAVFAEDGLCGTEPSARAIGCQARRVSGRAGLPPVAVA